MYVQYYIIVIIKHIYLVLFSLTLAKIIKFKLAFITVNECVHTCAKNNCTVDSKVTLKCYTSTVLSILHKT